nr:326_t:CDS:2 [Entrophospora candida]
MHLNQFIKYLLVLSSMVMLSSAQDSGDGFVFKCKTPGQVALTFDDGPSAANTPKLLKTLDTKNIKATFFVLTVNINEGNNKNILKQTFEKGHQIALHSSTHADMNKLSPAKVKEEYVKNLEAVKATIGKTPNYARPPFGNCNAACAKVMKELGLTVTQWSADSQDWQYAQAKEKQSLTVKNLMDVIGKGNPKVDSFITLQHDIQPFSVDFTPEIIDKITSFGYKFVTVSDCLSNNPTAYKEGDNIKTAPATPAVAPAPPAPPVSPAATTPAASPAATTPAVYPAATTPAVAPAVTTSTNKIASSSSILGISLFVFILGFFW